MNTFESILHFSNTLEAALDDDEAEEESRKKEAAGDTLLVVGNIIELPVDDNIVVKNFRPDDSKIC